MIRRIGLRATTALLGAGALLVSGAGPAGAQEAGKAAFDEICTACHSPGIERVVGPGLAGVADRRDRNWLVRKIMEPDRLLADGDSISRGLVEEHGMAMPNLGLSRSRADAIVAYLAVLDPADAPDAATEPREATFTAEQARLGKALFQGRRRLDAGGASCNSCHDVARPDVLGGGSLAVELTDVYGRLGPAAVTAILRNPPFPAMKQAYVGRAPDDEEIEALLAFFREADADSGSAAVSSYALLLGGTGILGSLLLAGVFTLAWHGRRRGPVSREIFDRQVRSR